MTNTYLHTVFLCLGTNLGDKQINLDLAIEHISERCGAVKGKSAVYRSTAWGYESENDFYNQCLRIETQLTPEQLIDVVLSIEQDLGRTRDSTGSVQSNAAPNRESFPYSDRIMDIDILFFDDMNVQSSKLVVPHPRISERRFILAPMTELVPDFVHPVNEKTMKVLLDECGDDGNVIRI